MKRLKLDEPLVFDLEFNGETLRVKIDHEGVTFWKRAVGNLNIPRTLDKYIQTSWEKIGIAGTCYVGTRTGHEERGPAMGRAGLNYLLHKNK